jgi:hypothetical protein
MDEPLSREDALADSVAQETDSASDITDASESGDACHGVEHGLEPEAMTDLQPATDVDQDHQSSDESANSAELNRDQRND